MITSSLLVLVTDTEIAKAEVRFLSLNIYYCNDPTSDSSSN